MFFTALILTAIIGFLNGWLLYQVNKRIWNKKIIKRISYFFPFLILVFALFWWIGTAQNLWWLRLLGAGGTSFIFVLNLMFLITLPISLAIKGLSNLFLRFKKKEKVAVDESRRLFLKTAVSAFPAIAVVSAGKGFTDSFSETHFPEISMPYANLPDAFNGFKILHLSDLHLGYYFGLDHLEKTLLDAEKYHVDMIAITGDIADDLSLMTEAMVLIDQLKTKHPKFVTLGNHEYFRGIQKSIKAIEKGPVPLLINGTSSFKIKDLEMVVAGVDDPVRLGGNKNAFFENALNKTFNAAPQGDFRLLLSHRPNVLDLADKFQIDLTLSGHTHGGQVGLGGRSFWDIFSENAYLWGIYKKGNSRLYTSAGMGHWFPFRLNCPIEAPIITLKKTV